MRKNHHRERGGSILILATCVLFSLAILAVAVSSYVSANINSVSWLKRNEQSYLLARSAVEYAIAETMTVTDVWYRAESESSPTSRGLGGEELILAQGSAMVYHRTVSDRDNIVTNSGLENEERRININKADRALIASLLVQATDCDAIKANSIAANVLDWRDPDTEPLDGGAENSYYAGLKSPYECRDGDFRFPEEILLVKDMTEEFFEGIRGRITVYGHGKVNVNTADPVVLMSLAHAAGSADATTMEAVVAKIENYRDAGHAFTSEGAAGILKQISSYSAVSDEERALLAKMGKRMSVGASCFRGTAVGQVGNENPATRRIEFVYDKRKRKLVYWHE